MSQSRCPFCTHDNPVRSRFCNECGSPLHLRPCPQCEAVSDGSARACRQCGFVFAAAPVETPERIAGDADPDGEAATRTADIAPAEQVDVPSAHVPESFAASLAPHGERIGDILLSAGRADASPASPAPDSAVASTTSPLRERAIRAPHTLGATLIVLLAAGICALAYFAYRPSNVLDRWLADLQLDLLGIVRAHATTGTAGDSADAPAQVSSSTAAASPASVSDVGTVTEPPDDAPRGAAATPESQAAVAPADSAPPIPTAVPSAEALALTTGDEATTSAPTDTDARALPSPGVADAASPGVTKGGRGAAARNATRRSAADARAIAARETGRAAPATAASPAAPAYSLDARPCTPAVAALGLCNASGSH
jgi:hypothetical protein